MSVLPHGIVPSASERYKLLHVASIICPDAISDARGLAIAEEPRVSGTLLLSAVRHYKMHQEQKIIESNNTGDFYKFINKKLSC